MSGWRRMVDPLRQRGGHWTYERATPHHRHRTPARHLPVVHRAGGGGRPVLRGGLRRIPPRHPRGRRPPQQHRCGAAGGDRAGAR
ncbi:hypothetical protein ACFFX0_12725 [Citricoccus parietis]|uniref:Uncharacterized protein n=1 Tax=Citricoccus parietis TaxID=592307 RepID=A0ABV5FZA6_9MICC